MLLVNLVYSVCPRYKVPRYNVDSAKMLGATNAIRGATIISLVFLHFESSR